MTKTEMVKMTGTEYEDVLRQQMTESLTKWIKAKKLDKDVIEVETGKRGILKIEFSWDEYGRMRYDLNFYPYTKLGEVSKKFINQACGIRYADKNFTPA